MSDLLSYVIAFGPFFAGAAVVAGALAGMAPWLWAHPERWLLWMVMGLGFIQLGGEGTPDGSLIRQVTWGGIFAVCGAWLLLNKENTATPIWRMLPPALLLVLAYALVSCLWSPIPLVSFKRAIQLFGVLTIALVVARAGGKATLRTQISAPAFFIIVVGLCVAVAAPSVAFDRDHALRGIGSHKNSWGLVSLLACFVLAFGSFDQVKRHWLPWCGMGIAVASLLLSKSSTSLISFVAVMVALGAWHILKARSAPSRAFSIAAIMTLVLILFGYFLFTGNSPFSAVSDAVYAATGKDQTLTGRHQLWQLVLAEIDRHPWRGLGYGGFWAGVGGPSTGIAARLNWGPPGQAHSGYLDVINELGYAGFGLVMLLLLSHAAKVVTVYRSGDTEFALFHAAILLAALITNYAESSLLRTTHIWWIVLCTSMVEIHCRVVTGRQRIPPQSGAAAAAAGQRPQAYGT